MLFRSVLNFILLLLFFFFHFLSYFVFKDFEITQNFTHFYIEGNKFNKDNLKNIISFLNKENFYMFIWEYNKEQTKKFGIINNIMKVANLSNKI